MKKYLASFFIILYDLSVKSTQVSFKSLYGNLWLFCISYIVVLEE